MKKTILLALGFMVLLGCTAQPKYVENTTNISNNSISLGNHTIMNYTIPKINSSCGNMSEEECFSSLSDCIKANSIEEFMNKSFPELYGWMNGWPENFTFEVNTSLKNNFPSAELMDILILEGGGDYGDYPFIRMGDLYCPFFSGDNPARVFGPIESKEQAWEYYMLLRHRISGAYAATNMYIVDEADYGIGDMQYTLGDCTIQEIKQAANGRVSTVTQNADGFTLD
ncbi:hypothetical protein KJ780_00360 [Candidatus Micrarchaeota archaeon]|nr:hypothetical protein [Candidatus Micrarchaeota archaeon]